MNSRLYKTVIHHLRYHPVLHEFRYGSYSFLFDLDELAELDRRYRLFSLNRPNIISFHEKDYGSGGETPLAEHVQKLLCQSGGERAHRIFLLTQPRVWGYVFNPLSVYYCLDTSHRLTAVIYEVSNTFGDRHSYVFRQESVTRQHGCSKLLHVSPFFDTTGTYRFRNKFPDEKADLGIRYQDKDDRLLFYASLKGRRQELSSRALLRLAFTLPPASFKVIGAIHWQALKLWLRKLKVFRRPVPPGPSSQGTFELSGKKPLEYGHEQ
ncbi:DUF1365 domain-containing protein [Emcibacter sp.]|uniref:DUF1365 domain-containing protein n=1 Tax=Emcibacter sp. TaxID=1979954 RepID=UPI003A8FCFEE